MPEVLKNAQVLITNEELAKRIDRANYTGHPELVYQVTERVRDGESEEAALAWITEQQDGKASSKSAAPAKTGK